MLKSDSIKSPFKMCSFCGKKNTEVPKLICGPGVCICEDCINICKGMLERGGKAESENPRQEGRFPIEYRVFKAPSASWAAALDEAKEFASTVAPAALLNITQSAVGDQGMVVVWYRIRHNSMMTVDQPSSGA